MMKLCWICGLAILAGASTSSAAPMEYAGLCEASAAVFIDATHFAVASDQSNRLLIYERDRREPVAEADLTGVTFDNSDLEGAAVIDGLIYWISSHSVTAEKQKDKKDRKILFTTRVVTGAGAPTLEVVKKSGVDLRDAVLPLLPATIKNINIEGLAPTPEGTLLIGARGPLDADGRAVIVELLNPADFVAGRPPELAPETVRLNLDGRGIRSLELLDAATLTYVIVGGPVTDADKKSFVLYLWDGVTEEVRPVETIDWLDLKPEALAVIPDTVTLLALSDDDHICDDEKAPPPEGHRFRSLEVTP